MPNPQENPIVTMPVDAALDWQERSDVGQPPTPRTAPRGVPIREYGPMRPGTNKDR